MTLLRPAINILLASSLLVGSVAFATTQNQGKGDKQNQDRVTYCHRDGNEWNIHEGNKSDLKIGDKLYTGPGGKDKWDKRDCDEHHTPSPTPTPSVTPSASPSATPVTPTPINVTVNETGGTTTEGTTGGTTQTTTPGTTENGSLPAVGGTGRLNP